MLIGDYIHYKYSNYKKYGLGINSDKSKESPSSIFKSQKEALRANFP
jgi:hypothetical protein